MQAHNVLNINFIKYINKLTELIHMLHHYKLDQIC